ncbi:polysaccharide ABC transporter ATP-binding protein [Polaribacter atrinae]|uniref:ABC transporter ATP-binding protein n=1 Tax=Polaribacter atrinae TaxID=1333662 RepID=UPI00248F6D54|nr:ABC transporter ATP-binding protein [Polaribacter atrinae]
MSETILKTENLSKQYRLGLVGSGTMSDDLKRWWYKIRGKEDPFLKIGDVNNRATKGESDYVWSLRDINFEVKKGEVLGIIGKNGAGKSTLLKILSKVTGPTTGSIKSNGRIASLLEVGTGFHPEMTGRENIFLNGAILGMTKKEIASKLDEIVEFSGCQRYIDTPTKRYSSGMTVRLAFAVAAFLEPDILIIDEVLAVGDAEFQKKAIGKMQDISGTDGRTVLFVSHNMAAVKSLCSRGIILENGKIVFQGSQDESVDFYLKQKTGLKGVNSRRVFKKEEFLNNIEFELLEFGIKAKTKTYEMPITREDVLLCNIELNKYSKNKINFVIIVKDESGNVLFAANNYHSSIDIYQKGHINVSMEIPNYFFNEGNFFIDLNIIKNRERIFNENDIINFTIIQEQKKIGEWYGKDPGALKPIFNWKVKSQD